MFRRWPFFQRLLSWTKPYAPAARGTRAYERYDWNSLLARTRRRRAIQPGLMDGTSYFPSRPGDGGEPRDVRRAGRRSTSATTAAGPRRAASRRRRRRRGSRSRRPTGSIAAPGSSSPSASPSRTRPPGRDGAHLPLRRRPARRDVCRSAGAASSASRIPGSSSRPGSCRGPGSSSWCRRRRRELSVETKTLVGVRARYVQPYEDFVLGGGVSVLDAAIDRIDRATDGTVTVHLRRTDGGADLALEVDDVISATGFVTPLRDLPDLGVTTFGASRLPGPDAVVGERDGARASTSRGPSARARRACRSTACRPTRGRSTAPATTPASSPSRSPGRVSGSNRNDGRSRPRRSPAFVAGELAEAPELFHQRGYLARVLTADPAGGWRDDGVQPLAHVLDDGGPDAVAPPSRPTGSGAIYPVVYTRHRRQGRRAGRSTRIRSCGTTPTRRAASDRRGVRRRP